MNPSSGVKGRNSSVSSGIPSNQPSSLHPLDSEIQSIFKRARTESLFDNLPSLLSGTFIVIAGIGAVATLTTWNLPLFALCSAYLVVGPVIEGGFHQEKIKKINEKIDQWNSKLEKIMDTAPSNINEMKDLTNQITLVCTEIKATRNQLSRLFNKFFKASALDLQYIDSLVGEIDLAVEGGWNLEKRRFFFFEKLKKQVASLRDNLDHEFVGLNSTLNLRSVEDRISGIWRKIQGIKVLLNNTLICAGPKTFNVCLIGTLAGVVGLTVSLVTLQLSGSLAFGLGTSLCIWLITGTIKKLHRANLFEQLAIAQQKINKWSTPPIPTSEEFASLFGRYSLLDRNSEPWASLKIERDHQSGKFISLIADAKLDIENKRKELIETTIFK
jgi:hypothetical protein